MGASAEASPDVAVTVQGGTAMTSGTGVRVGAYHNQNGEDVRAQADAAGGGLGLAANGTVVDARSEADTQVLLGNSTALAGGSGGVIVEALSDNHATATGSATSVGLVLGVGGVWASGASGGTTGAVSGADVTGSSLSVLAHADHTANVQATAAAGGLTAGVTGSLATSSVTPTVNAGLGDGAQVVVAGPASVIAEASTDADGTATGVGVSAGFSMGLSKADVDLNPTMGNRLGTGVSVTTQSPTADITVGMRLNNGLSNLGGATALASAASGGIAAGSGTDADASIQYALSQTSGSGVTLNAGRNVAIDQRVGSHAEADANSNTFGLAAAVGGAVANADIGGSATTALGSVSGSAGGSFTLDGTSNHLSTATSHAASGGLFSGQLNRATATFDPTLGVDLGGGGTITAGGDARVRMLSTADTTADALGIAAGAAGIGSSIATATMSPNIHALTGGETITSGGSILVQAQHNHNGTAPTGQNTVANAVASSGGALLGGAGASATADATANTTARVGGGSMLTATGTVQVLADGANLSLADSRGLGVGGLIGFGSSSATALANGSTHADLRGGVGGSTSVTVIGEGKNVADAQANASGAAGLAGVSGGSVTARANGDVSAGLGDSGIASNVNTTGAVLVDAISSADADADARALSFGLAGAVGIMSATSEVSPDVTAQVRGTTGVSGLGITVRARHNQAGEDSTAQGDAGTGGLGLALSGASANATAAADTKAITGNATSFDANGAAVLVSADANNLVTSQGTAFAVGGLAAGAVTATGRSGGITEATSGADVTDASNLQVLADATQTAVVTAVGAAGGLFAAGNGALATTLVDPDVRAGIGDGAQIVTANFVTVQANATTDADGTATGVAVSGGVALGLSKADVTLSPAMSLDMGSGASVTTQSASGDITLALRHNNGASNQGGASADAFAGAGGGLVGGGGAEANARVDYDMHHDSGSNVTLNAGRSVLISTLVGSHADADADAGGFGGIAGIGGAVALADIGGTVGSSRGQISGTQGQDFIAETTASHVALATPSVAAAGLYAGQVNSATATFDPTLEASLGSGGAIIAGRDVIVRSTSIADTTATALGISVGALSSGASLATATMSPSISAR
ncbi:MAG: hypothetical protein IPI44_07510 [Sulfuritalea sp.]|nr:hypothetical protein [Sulfuritalea sp.]